MNEDSGENNCTHTIHARSDTSPDKTFIYIMCRALLLYFIHTHKNSLQLYFYIYEKNDNILFEIKL